MKTCCTDEIIEMNKGLRHPPALLGESITMKANKQIS